MTATIYYVNYHREDGGDPLLVGGTVVAEGVTFPPGYAPSFSATRNTLPTLIMSNCPRRPDSVHTPYSLTQAEPGDSPGPGINTFRDEETSTPLAFSYGAAAHRLGEVFGVKGVPMRITAQTKIVSERAYAEVVVGPLTGPYAQKAHVEALGWEDEEEEIEGRDWEEIEIDFNPPFTGRHPVTTRVRYSGAETTVLFTTPKTGAG